MFEFMQNPLVALIAAGALLIGITGGLGIAVTLMFWDRTEKKRRYRPLKSPRRHKKETEQRAVRNAVLLVVGGTFQAPTRR